jgi:hypothetical protein
MRNAIVSGVSAAFVLVSSGISARADDPAPVTPAPVTMAPASNVPQTLELHLLPTLRLGEPSFRSTGLSDGDAFNPLRLSLLSGIFPIGNSIDPDCKNHAEMSGNTQNGFATKRSIFLRLTPQLSLHGFSSIGCTADSGAGGGITYTSLLRPNLWLVGSAGAYTTPKIGFVQPRMTSDVRVDIVMKNSAGRTFSVGLGAGGRNEGHGGSTVGGFRLGGSF